MVGICFNILNLYEKSIRDSLKENGLNSKEIGQLIKNLKLKNDVILSLNKEYLKGKSLDDFCIENRLDNRIPDLLDFHGTLYKHQEKAIKSILNEKCTIVSTGTGSGKTESFLVPIIDYCIKNKGEKGVKAIIIYPMNALAGDQLRRISDAVKDTDITFGIFTGDSPSYTKNEKTTSKSPNEIIFREDMVEEKPDILITNYVMLDRLLTKSNYNPIFNDSEYLKYVVLDEIHVYRGNKGLHIKYLLHRLKSIIQNKIVQIGCSATLSRDNEENLYKNTSNGIDNFVKTIFNVKNSNEYSCIEPIYEDIVNKKYEYEDEFLKNIANNKITSVLRVYLNTGCKTFKEVLAHLNENGFILNEENLKEYLEELLKANSKSNNNPILDFRIHLFLLEIGGVLKRCTHCKQFYTDNIKICNNCGELILPVYKKNPNYLVGVLKDGFVLPPKSKDIEKYPVVLLDLDETSNIDKNYMDLLRFDEFILKYEGIKINVDNEGDKKLYLFNSNIINLNANEKEIIIELNNKDAFLYEVMKEPLSKLKDNSKKLLAFIDNREKSSRLSVVFGDKFLSGFYVEFLKYVYSLNKNLSLNALIKDSKLYLTEYIRNESRISEDNKEIVLNEFQVWFARLILKIKKIVPIKPDLNISKDERCLIDILIDEGAYGNSFNLNKSIQTNSIRLNLEEVLRDKYIGFKSYSKFGNIISLSENGRKYTNIIKNLSPDKIGIILENLNKKGLVKITLDDENRIYSLNINSFKIILEQSSYKSIKDIEKENLLFTGVHNSEVDKISRKKYEEEFQKSEINLLLATPTLEMGIDIGKLSFVYMIGIPPMSSNYAQRAGRAGRRGNKFAALINICSEQNQHDWYYFNNPKKIIEGSITPPKFDINNINVLNKHINTIMIPMINNIENISELTKSKIKNLCEEIFDRKIDLDKHIKILKNLLRGKNSFNNIDNLYKLSIYPDYNFNRDDINLVRFHDKETLGTRDHYQAYKEIVPYQNMFVGNKHYFLDVNNIEENKIKNLNGIETIQCKEIFCLENEKQASDKREYEKSKKYILLENKNHTNYSNKGPLDISLLKDLKVEFIIETPMEKNTSIIAYSFKRDSILIKADTFVVNEKQFSSLISALDKAIKDEFGLDENEIGILINEDFEQYKNDFSDNYLAILYDKSGTKTIDIESIYNSLNNKIFQKAYEKIQECDCENENGCYNCLKSYNTQSLAKNINKKLAQDFLLYLIDKKPFRPQIRIVEDKFDNNNIIKIKISRDVIKFKYNTLEKTVEYKGKQKIVIIKNIAEIFKNNYLNEEYFERAIQIDCKADWVFKVLIKNSDTDLKDIFKIYKFYELPFKIKEYTEGCEKDAKK